MMPVLAAGSFLVALVVCSLLRRLAERRALFDTPNERSLHTVPVPRLGGVGVALGALATAGLAGAPLPWLVTTTLVSALGFVDDLRPVRAGVRFLGHVALAGALVAWAGAPARVVVVPGVTLALPPALGAGLAVLFLVATLNIYNFMDGMDGLAGTQALCAGVALWAATGRPEALLLAAASAGFLVHNYPPATIFLGDAGSTALGFGLAALGVLGAGRTPIATVLVALAPFLLDGTFTILRRARRLEPVWRPHRSHLYQRAVQAGRSHRDVLVVYAGWMVASAAAAIAVATSGWAVAVMVAAGSLAVLGGVRAWVMRLEATRPRP
jgi:UDP-N-acetylmuramyl pentapeptide phosphotransferase/UDP-N-acetylglucosamine-1-phosphate transferase